MIPLHHSAAFEHPFKGNRITQITFDRSAFKVRMWCKPSWNSGRKLPGIQVQREGELKTLFGHRNRLKIGVLAHF